MSEGRYKRIVTRRGQPLVEEYDTAETAIMAAYWDAMGGAFTKRIEAPDGQVIFHAQRLGYGIREFVEDHGYVD